VREVERPSAPRFQQLASEQGSRSCGHGGDRGVCSSSLVGVCRPVTNQEVSGPYAGLCMKSNLFEVVRVKRVGARHGYAVQIAVEERCMCANEHVLPGKSRGVWTVCRSGHGVVCVPCVCGARRRGICTPKEKWRMCARAYVA
jgi:hypothetical protein